MSSPPIGVSLEGVRARVEGALLTWGRSGLPRVRSRPPSRGPPCLRALDGRGHRAEQQQRLRQLLCLWHRTHMQVHVTRDIKSPAARASAPGTACGADAQPQGTPALAAHGTSALATQLPPREGVAPFPVGKGHSTGMAPHTLL
eukprot:167128-Chlamydomonas_euryale.AAC.9